MSFSTTGGRDGKLGKLKNIFQDNSKKPDPNSPLVSRMRPARTLENKVSADLVKPDPNSPLVSREAGQGGSVKTFSKNLGSKSTRQLVTPVGGQREVNRLLDTVPTAAIGRALFLQSVLNLLS
jgi:hypothetical protein